MTGCHEIAAPETLVARATLAAVASGALDSHGVVHRAVERARANAELNAFISIADELPATSKRPDGDGSRLAGLPIAVKDSIDVAGFPSTAGTPALSEWRPRSDAPVVRALRDAGAIVIGKNNLHEPSVGTTSNNPRSARCATPMTRR